MLLRRLALSVLLLAAAAWLADAVCAAPPAQGGENRAALIVRFNDGSVQTSCVGFSEPSITGEQVLQRSGLQPLIDAGGGLGGAVCSIDGKGCRYPSEDCFCKCMGSQCEYWAYYHRVDAGWQYSQVGAAGYLARDGALEGWSWGPGNFQSGTEPPAVAFADICKPGAAIHRVTGPTTSPALPEPAQYLAYGAAVAVLLLMGVFVLVRRRA